MTVLTVQRAVQVELRKKSVVNKIEKSAKTIQHFKNILYIIALKYDKKLPYTTSRKDLSIFTYFTSVNFLEKFCKGREKLPYEGPVIHKLKRDLVAIWQESLSSDVIKMIARVVTKEFRSVIGKRRAGLNASLPKPKPLKHLYRFTIDSNPNMVTDKRFLKRKFSNHVVVNLGRVYKNVKIKLPPQVVKAHKITNVKLTWISGVGVVAIIAYTPTFHRQHYKSPYYLSIDLGLNNLIAAVSNNPTTQSFIINGKPLKAFNQWCNKLSAKLSSNDQHVRRRALWFYRSKRIKHFMHTVANKLVQICVDNSINRIILANGLLKTFNETGKLGKKFNQQFRQVPLGKLISYITYKAEEVGIQVITHPDESYTSKTSAVNGYVTRKIFNGKRTKRGLFIDHINNKAYNADLNAALNIAIKAMGRWVRYTFLELPNWLDKLSRPVRITVPC